MASHFREEVPRKPARRSCIVRVIGWLVLFCGALLLLSPDIYEASYTFQSVSQTDIALKAIDAVFNDDGKASDGEEATSLYDAEALSVADKAPSSRPWLEDYNERVRCGQGPLINDPFTFGKSDQSFAATGLVDAPVGVLTVPAMGCEAPVYLGSSEQNMLRGAAVVAGTSAPLGESSSNCVIAAHRGMYFRWVEDVKIGDLAELRTIWGSFVYRVVDIKVIYPSDLDEVAVQEGRDLLTLSTCHPYGHNKKRIIVVCERDSSAKLDAAAGVLPSLLDAATGKRALSSVTSAIERGDVANQLFFEDCGRLLGRVLLVVVFIRLVVAIVSGVRQAVRLRG